MVKNLYLQNERNLWPDLKALQKAKSKEIKILVSLNFNVPILKSIIILIKLFKFII